MASSAVAPRSREVEVFAAHLAMLDFIDNEMNEASSLVELKARLVIWRKTHGWGRFSEEIGLAEFSQRLRIDHRKAKRVLAKLKPKGADDTLTVEERTAPTPGGKSIRLENRYRWCLNSRVLATLEKAKPQGSKVGVGAESTPTPGGQTDPHPLGVESTPTQSCIALSGTESRKSERSESPGQFASGVDAPPARPPLPDEGKNANPAIAEVDQVREALHAATGKRPDLKDTLPAEVLKLGKATGASAAVLCCFIVRKADQKRAAGDPVSTNAFFRKAVSDLPGWMERNPVIVNQLNRPAPAAAAEPVDVPAAPVPARAEPEPTWRKSEEDLRKERIAEGARQLLEQRKATAPAQEPKRAPGGYCSTCLGIGRVHGPGGRWIRCLCSAGTSLTDEFLAGLNNPGGSRIQRVEPARETIGRLISSKRLERVN